MKKLMKKWWFWALVLVIIIGISNMGDDEDVAETTNTDITDVKVKDKVETDDAENEVAIELTPKETIEQAVADIVDKLQTTTLKDVTINKHAGTDDPDDFIVLIYLSFDAKNRANTAKSMIDLYNNEIGARLADIPEITEITTFWEVPYLLEGQNVAKANMERVASGMAFKDKWYDGRIFE